MLRIPFISLFCVVGLVACGGNNPVDRAAANTRGLPDINAPAPSAMGEPHVATEPAKANPAPAAMTIPAALHGRWALTPADCIPGRSDAKGLLIIAADGLQFYESHAVPTADVDIDGDSLSGTFAFTGEGQSWTKFEALRAAKGRLTRTETKPAASFSYAKCS